MKKSENNENNRKSIIIPVLLILCIIVCLFAACSADKAETSDQDGSADQTEAAEQADAEPIPIKVLILPKFEVGDMSGDFPGEAQLYYDEYLAGGDEYELQNGTDTIPVYVKDGVALCVVGEGKVASAINTAALLADDRFDFSEAYILSTGCAGSAEGYGIMGDVFVISAAADCDLGHKADPRELSGSSDTTWFHDSEFDKTAVVKLNENLTDRVYELVKDIHPKTTERTRKCMKDTFPGEKWADRDPEVLRGTAVTGDNFWKGEYDHRNAELITKTYECPDPYAVTEMEDAAVGQAVKSFGLLDRFIIVRGSVNMDVFMQGATPESLWGEHSDDDLISEDSTESADIFETAMKNNFEVGRVIIDAALDGSL